MLPWHGNRHDGRDEGWTGWEGERRGCGCRGTATDTTEGTRGEREDGRKGTVNLRGGLGGMVYGRYN